MAKKVSQGSQANRACFEFHSFKDFKEGIFNITSVLRGRIMRIEWIKTKKGISQVTHAHFMDNSSCKITLHQTDKGTIHTSVKVTS